jgi:hypothetical protein
VLFVVNQDFGTDDKTHEGHEENSGVPLTSYLNSSDGFCFSPRFARAVHVITDDEAEGTPIESWIMHKNNDLQTKSNAAALVNANPKRSPETAFSTRQQGNPVARKIKRC